MMRNYRFVLSPIFLFLLFTLSFALLSGGRAWAVNNVPDRKLEIVEPNGEKVPEWKVILDQARKQMDAGQETGALHLYEKLLKLKPTVDVARWEYSKLLYKAGKYSETVIQLQRLIESSSENIPYSFLYGDVLNKTGNYQKAFAVYAGLYNREPDSSEVEEALRGMIFSLELLGREKLAVPFLRQLMLKRPDDSETVYKLGMYLYLKEDVKGAREVLKTAVKRFNLDDKKLLKIEEKLQYPEDSDVLFIIWKRYLEKNPGYVPFIKKLADYSLDKGLLRERLEYLIWLDEHKIDGEVAERTLEIADITFHILRRPDKAMVYYRRYAEVFPENFRIQQIIKSTQALLAEDFLAIVKNGGTELLWEDLGKINTDRKTIFLICCCICILCKKMQLDFFKNPPLLYYKHL